MSKELYMVVEHFKNKDAVSVYCRFRERGRMAPDGFGLHFKLGRIINSSVVIR